MQLILRNLLLIAMIVQSLAFTTPAMGQGGRKPERDDAPAMGLTDAQRSDLAKAWVDQKRPSMSLFVGYFEKDGPAFRGTQLENQLRNKIESMITSAPGLQAAIILPDVNRLQQQQQQDAMKGNVAPERFEAIAGLLQRQNGNDRIAIIVLLQSAGNGKSTVSLQVRDLRNARSMGGNQYIAMDEQQPDIGEVWKFSTAIVVEVGQILQRAVAARELGRPIQLRLLGLRNNEQVDDVASMLEGKDGVVSVSAAADRQARSVVADFEVWYKGETRSLVRTMRDALKDNSQSLRQIQTRDDFVLAEILSTRRPAWWQLTDVEEPGFAEKLKARARALQRTGNPRVGVVVGTDLVDPVASFSDPQFQQEHGATAFRHAELSQQIEDWLTQVGFEVRSADALRAKIADRIRQADRFADASKLADALRNDMPDFDVVVYVSAAPAKVGAGFTYTAQMINWQDATIVGSQRWPEPGFDTFDECPIDPGNVKDVARYVVGNLVERWDRFVDRRGTRATIQVVIKQVDDPNKIQQIADVFRSIPSVQQPDGIDRVNVSGALAAFDVAYSGRPGPLVEAFNQKIGALSFPVHVEGQSESELVLNLGAPEAAKQAPSASAIEQAGKDLKDRKARPIPNSWVLLIGINYAGDPIVGPALRYCVSDVRLMHETLTKRAGYPADRVVVMTDDLPPNDPLFPTGPNIIAQIDSLGKKIRPGDQVVIHFSGHGDTPKGPGGNALFDKPALAARSFAYNGQQVATHPGLGDIRDILRRNQAGQVILFIDACHSGSADVGLAGAASRDNAPLDAIYAAIAANNQSMITLAGSRLNQYSLESLEHKHGYFTWFIAQGLSGLADTDGGNRDGKITFDELYGYVFDQVSKATKGAQQPFMSAAVIDRPVLADYSE